ncbi:NAD(P)/FAD-dependent oxidoreductase [Roseibium algae]|uniref:FAD-dependent oxidoreductase n=1 Tax=Roseibium algae TaxID=3123038 RepID=A0ABU8TKY2_9HYPH
MRIAVIGSGIAGNSAAWALSDKHKVVLYEKRQRPGGHSATVDIDYDGTKIAVDTGFIVYNELNYPHFTALLDHLGVATEASDMSFALSSDEGRHEWAGQNLNTIFAKRSNLVSPRFLWMLREILRFNKSCAADSAAGHLEDLSLGQYLEQNSYSTAFINDYLLPMGAAIWSMPLNQVLQYPAESFVSFFENHKLINFDRPTWRTISGGSRNYVQRLLAPLAGHIRYGAMVANVQRKNGKVQVTDSSGETDTFDQVILASHTDQSLAMLSDATVQERTILSAIKYRPNTVYLHRDENLMPKRKRVWASWNYLASSNIGTNDLVSGNEVTVSYWMNKLQNIDQSKPLFVTLNPTTPPHDDLTFAQFVYDHPQFNAEAIKAQKNLDSIQGIDNIWFCGAWAGHGFHEDGLSAGLSVARRLGAELPWETTADKETLLEAAE